jgi:hypothetical protein
MLEIDKVSLPSVVYSVCCHFAAALRTKLVISLCLQAFGERLRRLPLDRQPLPKSSNVEFVCPWRTNFNPHRPERLL